MTFHSRPVRNLCALLFAALLAAPLAAATKPRKRVVTPPKIEQVNISGTVTDAVSGEPLKGAVVTSGGTFSAVTDANGHYALTTVLTSDATASRVGYNPVKKPVTGTQLDFALPRGPVVTVKTTAGQTIVLDFASTKFGYPDGFQYVSSDTINGCKAGGEPFTPEKTAFAKITGPAHLATESACCSHGPFQALDADMKNGQHVTVFLVDTCFGLAEDILGVERSSATAKYIHLSDVSEITFP
jgi:hypothetical protein